MGRTKDPSQNKYGGERYKYDDETENQQSLQVHSVHKYICTFND